MQIDLRTVTIKPLRHTFDHIARYLGTDKPVSRYLEGSIGIQPKDIFHYRPTWEPEREIFDEGRTKIRMKDWDALKDPRQFYYGAYTSARARQQDTAEANFDFVESRGLVEALPEEVRQAAVALLVPLRHLAWGANMNNAAVCAYAYGGMAAQAAIYQSMDQLGIAQYLTRIGLLLGDVEALSAGKQAWMNDPAWQPLRRYVEDSFVVKDPFELHTVQNLVLDGLLYPLVYDTIVDQVFAARGGAAIAMLTQFMTQWSAETRKWVDATLKAIVTESAENRSIVQDWVDAWLPRAKEALLPVSAIAVSEQAPALLDEVMEGFAQRLAKIGLSA